MSIDYSLYLVTDRGILKGRDLLQAVEAAIKGGVTMIQLREKSISSLDFYNIALKVKEVAKVYNVPFIINDRLDIALAVDADGLHIGQDDLPLQEARKLLGKSKLLGYSVTTAAEARFGEENGADYLGAGPVFPTGSKDDAALPIGVCLLKEIKDSVSLPVVGIGGISLDNVSVIRQAGIDGISVISAILGRNDIKAAARFMADAWRKP